MDLTILGLPRGSTLTDLTPTGGYSAAYSINIAGQVVGYSETLVKGVIIHNAFLYDPNTSTKLQDLNSIAMPPAGF